MKPKMICLIELSYVDSSEQRREEIEKILGMIKKTGWNIERIMLLEDRRGEF
ncbi:hypothetical protein J7K07_02775 [Candidatus Bathyarchaeota archaeon]|nr:hypothetical protein [Candidatus Bathyarchaeota archaeon]